jgi:hypothetical protein
LIKCAADFKGPALCPRLSPDLRPVYQMPAGNVYSALAALVLPQYAL